MSGTNVEDDRGGIGMKIANDNPKLSFLLPFCHSCESQESSLDCCGPEKERPCEKEKALLDTGPD